MRVVPAAIVCILLITACASDEVADIETTELKAYQSAQSSLSSGNYQAAVSKLQLLEARYPFGRFAEPQLKRAN